MSIPNLMSIGAFNKHMGYKGRYAYELHKNGRLVMSEDGKQVLVAESIRRIAESRDPSRAGVAERHERDRGYSVSTPPASSGDSNAQPLQSDDSTSAERYVFTDGKSKREHFAALREEVAYRKEAGELLAAGDVIGAFADAAAKVAGVLDALPATVGPMLAGLSQEEVMRTLTDQMDIARAEMAAAINKLAAEIEDKQKGAAQ